MEHPYLIAPSRAGVFKVDIERADEVGTNRVYVGINPDPVGYEGQVDLVSVRDCDDGSGDVEIRVYGEPGNLEPTHIVRIHSESIREALGE